MKKMNKIIAVVMVLLVCVAAFAGCSMGKSENQYDGDSELDDAFSYEDGYLADADTDLDETGDTAEAADDETEEENLLQDGLDEGSGETAEDEIAEDDQEDIEEDI